MTLDYSFLMCEIAKNDPDISTYSAVWLNKYEYHICAAASYVIFVTAHRVNSNDILIVTVTR